MWNKHIPIQQKKETNMTPNNGLMSAANKSKVATPILDKLRAELHPEPKTLEEELAAMNDQQRLGLLSIYKMIAMMYDPNDKRSFPEHVNKMQPRARASQKGLYERMLKEFMGDREYQEAEKPVATDQTKYSYNTQSSFLDKLIQSESSGDTEAEITIEDGRTFTGALQFGAARLADFMQSSGRRFTQDEFKADTVLQDEVAQWSTADIDKAIDALGDTAKGFDRDGLKSVAHLGGKSGMAKYVTSGGQYNPSDELGTSLSDYYNKFST
jgi:hypothetical protein